MFRAIISGFEVYDRAAVTSDNGFGSDNETPVLEEIMLAQEQASRHRVPFYGEARLPPGWRYVFNKFFK